MTIKIEEPQPYVSTRRLVDDKGKYVGSTQTKDQAETIVNAVSLYQELINKYAND